MTIKSVLERGFKFSTHVALINDCHILSYYLFFITLLM